MLIAEKTPVGRKVKFLKWASLFALMCQSVVATAMLRYSRERQPDPKKQYLTSSSVAMAELYKLLMSSVFLLIDLDFSWSEYKTAFRQSFVLDWTDTLKSMLPAFLYLIQNNLLWAASNYLDPAVYLATYQTKILTTALFMVVLLGRTISRIQWFSLLLLILGVTLLQVGLHDHKGRILSTDSLSEPLFGLLLLVTACFLSGFAGVYFELILKSSPVSLWMRNVQMSSASLAFGIMTCYFYDAEVVWRKGLFHGFDWFVWLTIVAWASGGLLVACAIKYADNIMKGFATAFAIVISAFTDSVFFGSRLTSVSQSGAALVVISVLFYHGVCWGIFPRMRISFPKANTVSCIEPETTKVKTEIISQSQKDSKSTALIDG
ncbi:unnamed protein product [Notodromas monacha]|uniref:UDP-galactose transporter n=1 Tax=Notodromas monacha TaxID=399045 RepID=A0A7R9GC07_9CRUS|nr:unnamed protein product [Notodromas monacha]CAG0915356.1 unnamed protein product [Notodromas monacha]